MTRYVVPSLALFFAVGATAQPTPPTRPVHHIGVQVDGNQCTYRIKDQEDQDRFVVSSRGRVVFQSQGGLKVQAVIAASDDGTKGTKGPPWTSGSGDQSLDVRDPIGYDTEHEVNISCCMEREGNTCLRWTRAVAAAEDLGTAHHVPETRASGPSAEGSPLARPRGDSSGGPKMEVDD